MKKIKKHKWKYQINVKKKIIVLGVLGVSLFVGLGYAIIGGNLGMFGTLEYSKIHTKEAYEAITRRAEDGCAKKYTGNHQDSMDPSKSTEDIYYYDGSDYTRCPIQNMNNVLFADSCWQMIRTTDTGGVRMIYNGEPEITEENGTKQYNCGNTRNLYDVSSKSPTTVNLSGTYLYAKEYTKTETEISTGIGMVTATKFTLENPQSIAVDSDNAAEQIANIVANYPYTCKNTTGICYAADDVTNYSTLLYKINGQSEDTTANAYKADSLYNGAIGRDFYSSTSPIRNVGYMYGNSYNATSSSNSGYIQKNSYIFLDNIITNTSAIAGYKYTDSVTWNSSRQTYVLENASDVSSLTDYSELVGKYIAPSTSFSSNVIYVAGIDESKGILHTKNFSYVYNPSQKIYVSFSDSISDNGDGTYSLDNPTTIDLSTWYSHRDEYIGKYTCGNIQESTTCQTPRYLYRIWIGDNSSSGILNKIISVTTAGNITVAKSRNGLDLVDYITIPYGEWIRNYYTNYQEYHYTCGTDATTCAESDLKYVYDTRIVENSIDMYYYYPNRNYAKSITYENDKYILHDVEEMETILDLDKLSTHHYRCDVAGNECTTVEYIHNYTGVPESDTSIVKYAYILKFTDGVKTTPLELINDLDKNNISDSVIKTKIDTWYENILKDTVYESKIDDTIYCNDRSFDTTSGYTFNESGWNPNGGMTNKFFYYKGNHLTSDLSCTNSTDRFSVSNNSAKLSYPISVISAPEMNLLGNKKARENRYSYWLNTPYCLRCGYTPQKETYPKMLIVNDNGEFEPYPTNMENYTYSFRNKHAIRPAISLIKGTKFINGNGSMTNPYVVDMSE